MKQVFSAAVLLLSSLGSLPAQLAPEQRRVEFEVLASFVAKAYAPYEWKRDALGFDAFAISQWLDRVERVESDLEFYEICAEYVASLQDLHSGFYIPSDFVAFAPLGADIYDGKVLIDDISRADLPAGLYPFEVGDELLTVDGLPAMEWVEKTAKIQSFANSRATLRWAADQIFFRAQSVIPRAHEIGDTVVIQVSRRATGEVESYEIPWTRIGTPLLQVGPVPTPSQQKLRAAGIGQAEPALRPGTRYGFTDRSTPREKRLRGFGSLRPVFDMPDGFSQRLGLIAGDQVFSGSYLAEGKRIGFLRIPSFPSTSFAYFRMLSQVQTELLWFKANTNGLIVDVMRNPGGDVCLTNELLRMFMTDTFRTVGDEWRPTKAIVDSFRAELEDLKSFGGTDREITLMSRYTNDIETAYSEYRGRTGLIPACGYELDLPPARDNSGNLIAYDKPLLVLIDEFSTSSADVFPAVLQDSRGARLFGMATAGGGGLSVSSPLGFYSESSASLSVTLGVRSKSIQVPGFPESPYIENLGAQPDVVADIMTLDNLLQEGKPFTDAFTQEVLRMIQATAAPALPEPLSASTDPSR
jgi:hypothetical protein